METVLYILFAIVVVGLRVWITYKNPDPAKQDRIADDLFDIAMKVGKEKREGKDTSELQAEYEQKLKNFEENGRLVSSDDAQFYADDLFDMAMKVGREKREGKDTSKQEAEYEQKLKDLEEIQQFK